MKLSRRGQSQEGKLLVGYRASHSAFKFQMLPRRPNKTGLTERCLDLVTTFIVNAAFFDFIRAGSKRGHQGGKQIRLETAEFDEVVHAASVLQRCAQRGRAHRCANTSPKSEGIASSVGGLSRESVDLGQAFLFLGSKYSLPRVSLTVMRRNIELAKNLAQSPFIRVEAQRGRSSISGGCNANPVPSEPAGLFGNDLHDHFLHAGNLLRQDRINISPWGQFSVRHKFASSGIDKGYNGEITAIWNFDYFKKLRTSAFGNTLCDYRLPIHSDSVNSNCEAQFSLHSGHFARCSSNASSRNTTAMRTRSRSPSRCFTASADS